MFKNLYKYTTQSSTFVFLLVAGIICTSISADLLKNNIYQFGPDTMAFFFPPFFTSLYFTIIGYQSGFTKRLLAESVLLFLIMLVPLWNYLFKVILPNPYEDFERYMVYAKNMVQNKTFWGGDRLVFKNQSNALITQPGARYFIAFELLIFKQLYRFVSILNLLLFCCSTFFLQKLIFQSITNNILKLLLGLLVLLSVPYATKNILMGLSEWLTVSLIIGTLYFYFIRKSLFISILFLALIPFLRQNTLPVVLFLFSCFIYKQKNWGGYIFLFLLTLLLPLYHNLYYAGEWRFFTSIFKWPFLNYDASAEMAKSNGFSFFHVFNNSLHYLGLHFRINRELDFMEESFLFLWLFIFLFIFMGKQISSGFLRIVFFSSSLLMVLIPGILLATDFYPRFEFVNVYLILAVFLTLYKSDKSISALPGFHK